MKYIDLNGTSMPALGLGTWQLDGKACERAVAEAMEIGYRHIDTAQAYGNEREVSRAVAAPGLPRDAVFVTSKVWMDRLEPEALRRSVDASLTALRLDYVDLMLIHWLNPEVPLADSLKALEETRASGKTRLIGVRNFPVALLREAVEEIGAPVVVNQVEYHCFLDQTPVLDYLRRHRMALTAYSPLARGAVFKDEALQRIGARHGKSAAQVALRWLIQQDGVAAIPKAGRREHAEANLAIFDFELSADEMAEIDRLPKDRRQINPSLAPRWDTAA